MIYSALILIVAFAIEFLNEGVRKFHRHADELHKRRRNYEKMKNQ